MNKKDENNIVFPAEYYEKKVSNSRHKVSKNTRYGGENRVLDAEKNRKKESEERAKYLKRKAEYENKLRLEEKKRNKTLLKEQKKLKKAQKEKIKKERKIEIKQRRKATLRMYKMAVIPVFSALIISSSIIALISMRSKVAQKRYELNKINKEISEILNRKEKFEISLENLSRSDIVEKYAIEVLKMKYPSARDIVYIDIKE